MENTFVKGIVAGALIGGVAALILAPKTGKESRHLLASGAGQARHKAGKAWGNMRHRWGKDNHHEAMADNNTPVGATNVFED